MPRPLTLKRLSNLPAIVVDTREQLPYEFDLFESRTIQTVRAALHTGDYSLVGFEDRICVERKSKADLFGSLGKGRARFKREFQRMAEMKFAALVIEASLTSLCTPPAHSKMGASAVVNSLISWAGKYGVQCWLCDCRYYAELVTLRTLEKFWLAATSAQTAQEENQP